MSVQFVSGDIFLSDAQTLAHGCNCKGRMGAGIALEIRRRYPLMFEEYKRRCRSGLFLPGGNFLYKESRPWILNLATQDVVGSARIEYVVECFQNLTEYCRAEGITSLAMPRIAAGLGGVDWKAVKGVIRDILDPMEVPIVVYEDYQEGLKAKESLESTGGDQRSTAVTPL